MTTMLASDLPLPRIGRGKVRDIYAVGDDRVLLLDHRPHQRLRRRDGRDHPDEGRGADPDQRLVVPPARGRGAASHDQRRRRRRSSREVPALQGHRAALAGRAMLCRRTHGVSGRMRDPRLSLRLGVEGIRRAGHARRREAAAGPAGKRQARAADLQSGDQGRDRPRREHHDRADARDPRRRGRRRRWRA